MQLRNPTGIAFRALIVPKQCGFANLYAVTINKRNQHLFAVDYLIRLQTIPKGSNITEYDASGIFIEKFGRSGSYDGPLCRYHDISVDNEGNIYVFYPVSLVSRMSNSPISNPEISYH